MIKYFCTLILILPVFIFSQEIESTAGKYHDSIHIHWVPRSIDAYSKLVNSKMKIDLIPWNSTLNPKQEDFKDLPQMKSFVISGIALKLKQDSAGLSPSAIIMNDGILNAEDSIGQKMLFANALLFSGVNRSFSKSLGFYISVPDSWSSNYLGYRLILDKEKNNHHFGVVVRKELEKVQFDSLKLSAANDEVALEWNVHKLNRTFSAYNILRSKDGKVFQKINKLPFFHMITENERKNKPARFSDKEVEPGHTYYYKLEGIDHLGFSRGVSNIIEVVVPNPLSGEIYIKEIQYTDGKVRAKIKVVMDSTDFDRVAKSVLFLANDINGKYKPFQKIKTSKKEYFQEEKASSFKKNGYMKIALISSSKIDTLWSEPRYYFFRDSIPPLPPNNLIGEIDSTGKVSLSWDRVYDDLKGYRVFRRNSENEEFLEVTKNIANDTFYVDHIDLKNLTQEIYYAVVSTDQNYNNSTLSKSIQLKKPDKIPPVPTIIRKTETNQDGVLLSWVKSPSSDLKNMQLQKLIEGKFQTIFETIKDSFYLDDQVQSGSHYSYRIKSIDNSGNVTFCEGVELIYELGFCKAPEIFDLEVDREKRVLEIHWRIPDEYYAVYLYVKKEKGEFILERSLFEKELSVRLQNLPINYHYQFKIQYMHPSGKMSQMSEVVELDY